MTITWNSAMPLSCSCCHTKSALLVTDAGIPSARHSCPLLVCSDWTTASAADSSTATSLDETVWDYFRIPIGDGEEHSIHSGSQGLFIILLYLHPGQCMQAGCVDALHWWKFFCFLCLQTNRFCKSHQKWVTLDNIAWYYHSLLRGLCRKWHPVMYFYNREHSIIH